MLKNCLQYIHLVCFEKCGGGTEFPWWHSGKESTHDAGDTRDAGFDPWVGKMPWNRKWQPTPESCLENFSGQRDLAGCSPWGRRESDTTEQLN